LRHPVFFFIKSYSNKPSFFKIEKKRALLPPDHEYFSFAKTDCVYNIDFYQIPALIFRTADFSEKGLNGLGN